jgi:hypothetical protein
MMDYQGYWQGFLLLFGILPVICGALIGLVWAYRAGKRGWRLIPSFFLGGAIAGPLFFVAAILFFRG